MRKFYYHLKRIIGEFLYKINLLMELSIYYEPEYRVYWGKWYWEWKRIAEAEKRFKEMLERKNNRRR